jgi:prepilin-type N-terminal cleavage/methylation domain-containing protein
LGINFVPYSFFIYLSVLSEYANLKQYNLDWHFSIFAKRLRCVKKFEIYWHLGGPECAGLGLPVTLPSLHAGPWFQQEIILKHNRIAGFTLIEVIVVISILCAAVISVPPMLQWLRQQGLRHAVEQLQADLQLARMTAIRQRQTCALSFNTPGLNQYINSSTHRHCDLTAYRGDVHFLKHGPDGMKMAAEVNFDRQGMSTTVIPSDIFVSDGDGSATYRIRVLLPGGISVYRWSGDHWQ